MYIAFLRLFKGLGNLNDLRVLRVLNFLKAPGFLYKKRQSMQGGKVGRRGATAAAENGWRGRQPMECG